MLVAVALDKAAGLRVREWVKVWDSWRIYRDMICTITNFPGEKISFLYSFVDGRSCLFMAQAGGAILPREGANKQVISSQADSLIKISRIWADYISHQQLESAYLGYFFRHFWRYFRFLLRSLPLTYHLVHPKQVGQGE